MNQNSALQTIVIFCGVGVLLYMAYIAFFYLTQRTILFPRHLIPVRQGTPPSAPTIETHWLITSQGQVEVWFFAPDPQTIAAKAPLFVIAHGNAELIDDWVEPARVLQRMGGAVLLVEYPGYGRSQGQPSEAAITEALTIAYDAFVGHPLVDSEAIVLFGRSVGGGAIAQLAKRRPSAALVLLSTFTSVRSMAAGYGLPGWAVRDRFDVLSTVAAYPQPVFIFHGVRDQIIPYAHAAALQQATTHGTLIRLDCDHNDCVRDWAQFWEALRPLLATAGIRLMPAS